MVVEGMQAVTVGLSSISHWNDVLGVLNTHIQVDWTVLAQDFSNVGNPLTQFGNAWNHFVKTGQIWAFLIGVVLGYLFRGFTSF